jgi:hypothetical protein
VCLQAAPVGEPVATAQTTANVTVRHGRAPETQAQGLLWPLGGVLCPLQCGWCVAGPGASGVSQSSSSRTPRPCKGRLGRAKLPQLLLCAVRAAYRQPRRLSGAGILGRRCSWVVAGVVAVCGIVPHICMICCVEAMHTWCLAQ